MSIGASSRGTLGLGAPADISNDFVLVPSVSFTLNPGIPTILDNDAIPVPSKAFTLNAFPPTINVGPLIVVPSKAFTLNTFPPGISASEILPVPSVAFTLNTFPPFISDGSTVVIPSKAFTFTANPPEILFDSALLDRTVNVACTGEAFIILLSIEHPSLTPPARISNDPTQLLPIAQVRGTISNGDEYVYLPFEFIFPNQESDTSPVAQLRIDNVSREISTIIDSISSPPTIQIQVVLSSTPDIVELVLRDFKLQRTEWNILTITGDITVEHFEQEPYPSGRFNPSGFPGLFAN